MKSRTTFRLQVAAAAFVLFAPIAASAADPTLEVGTTMMGATIGLGSNDEKVLGVPSAGFGLVQPGVYASIFLGRFVAVEPQVGLIWASTNGHSDHVVNFSGQLDYFFLGTNRESPYAFGTVGILDASGSNTNPKTVGGGLGYRFPVGDRLTFRLDGRYSHFTDGGGNMLGFGLSIGGLFGLR